jgi:hypothetical protein
MGRSVHVPEQLLVPVTGMGVSLVRYQTKSTKNSPDMRILKGAQFWKTGFRPTSV